ncbi:MAG: DNA translocase FtsK 4TM domain-containing protein [Lachnospiraceae bacterium]|nr:DNA translocase FtsK 4TM domain-containing protein [Lachnospiraceae bacterium]
MAQKNTKSTAKSKGGSAKGGAKRTSAAKKTSTAKQAAKKTSDSGRTKKQTKSAVKKADNKEIEIIDKAERKGSNLDNGFKMSQEITVLLLFAFSVILMMGNFGLTGSLGSAVNSVLFGIFGSASFIFPIAFFFVCAFIIVNDHNRASLVRAGAISLLYIDLSMFFQLAWNNDFETRKAAYAGDPYYKYAVEYKHGGGFLGGHLLGLLLDLTGHIGAIIILITIALICIVVLTGRSIVRLVAEGSKAAAVSVKDTAYDAYEEIEERRVRRHQGRRGRVIYGREKIDSHYMENTRIVDDRDERSDEMRELSAPAPGDDIDINDLTENLENSVFSSKEEEGDILPVVKPVYELKPESCEPEYEKEDLSYNAERYQEEPLYEDEPVIKEERASFGDTPVYEEEPFYKEEPYYEEEPAYEPLTPEEPVRVQETMKRSIASSAIPEGVRINNDEVTDYILPKPSMLERGKGQGGSNKKEQEEVAEALMSALASFGVNVKVTGVSCGPTVTRYELLPERGVKVAKILGLTDDIKLALAAESIRIEAPIPGKSAVGIEVPNKNIMPVMLRDLFESDEFKNSSSKISFAVGKDIGGKTVVFDIAKMPHVLIAGATGAGKSVCINTIIMSILFKARPDEVKLIMIDPKVVELSIYNGIPHLLTPVVTDPQKAAGALQWGVAEMDKRYNSFAEHAVRDLKGYNAKAVKEGLPPMPQLVIIVDELADLMMTAKNDVENAIVRLAQKARAAGIHLIIATQRPSVDVITGLIKANMPSRVAFTVTSGTDSRTILDMVGAEKLLGKGDMLFYPVGYPKPARVQGAFVSDEDVEKVAEFIRSQKKEDDDQNEITAQIEQNAANSSNGSSSAGALSTGGDSDADELYDQIEEFVLELDKPTVSIGLIQRKFRLGFNRAARIMDELHDNGIVGEEAGTKGRPIIRD